MRCCCYMMRSLFIADSSLLLLFSLLCMLCISVPCDISEHKEKRKVIHVVNCLVVCNVVCGLCSSSCS